MLSKTLSPTVKTTFEPALLYLTAGMWAIILWLGAIDVLEMAVTEWNFMYNSLPGSWKIMALLSLLLVFSGFLARKKRFVSYTFFASTILIFCVGLFAHRVYTNYYDWLQTFPKLRSISSLSSIQAEKVVITGKNFGGPDQRGSVKVDSLEFLIVSWDDEIVVAEQPVPNRYFRDDMVLTNAQGNTLVIPGFSIKDPQELWQ